MLFCGELMIAQTSGTHKYWVEFTDKLYTKHSIFHPQTFLSPRAIERRQRHGIPITYEDLPVSLPYINQIKEIGAQIHNCSKWLNAATIIADSSKIETIQQLPFVQQITFVGKHSTKRALQDYEIEEQVDFEYTVARNHWYGYAYRQNELLGIEQIHQKKWQGEGMMIAVLDGGFAKVQESSFFENTAIVATYDFVENDKSVYESSVHGSEVLSVMGANRPHYLVGTAPKAQYVCLKTEDVLGESIVEECNWIAAAEFADSMGVDVINTSLGYSVFRDRRMNYTYENMDGQTSKISQAADIAFRKGILVVGSAGNSGDEDWRYITTPADAFDILSVGASTAYGNKAFFSSFGPTIDGRIKPEVVAMGQEVNVASVFTDKVYPTNGTSYSAPLVAGAMTCLWQAFPELSVKELKNVMLETASLADSPNNRIGYGMPNMNKAFQKLAHKNGEFHLHLNEGEELLAVVQVDKMGNEHHLEEHQIREKEKGYYILKQIRTSHFMRVITSESVMISR